MFEGVVVGGRGLDDRDLVLRNHVKSSLSHRLYRGSHLPSILLSTHCNGSMLPRESPTRSRIELASQSPPVDPGHDRGSRNEQDDQTTDADDQSNQPRDITVTGKEVFLSSYKTVP